MKNSLPTGLNRTRWKQHTLHLAASRYIPLPTGLNRTRWKLLAATASSTTGRHALPTGLNRTRWKLFTDQFFAVYTTLTFPLPTGLNRTRWKLGVSTLIGEVNPNSLPTGLNRTRWKQSRYFCSYIEFGALPTGLNRTRWKLFVRLRTPPTGAVPTYWVKQDSLETWCHDFILMAKL